MGEWPKLWLQFGLCLVMGYTYCKLIAHTARQEFNRRREADFKKMLEAKKKAMKEFGLD